MAYIINPNPIIEYTFVIPNATLQTITANVPILLKDDTFRPFAIIAASLLYTNATTIFKNNVASGYGYILIGGVLMALYQDNSGSSFEINPGRAISYQVNYDQSGALFCDEFRGDSIEISFDSDYVTGNGDFVLKILGFYF